MIIENPSLKNKDRAYHRKEAEELVDKVFEIVKSKKVKYLMLDLIEPKVKAKEDDLYG